MCGKTETENYDRKRILEEYGLEPKSLIEVKGLQGDTSDNIPGVPGIGEKTAINLIKEYGSIENIYKLSERERKKQKIDSLPGSLKAALINLDKSIIAKGAGVMQGRRFLLFPKGFLCKNKMATENHSHSFFEVFWATFLQKSRIPSHPISISS